MACPSCGKDYDIKTLKLDRYTNAFICPSCKEPMQNAVIPSGKILIWITVMILGFWGLGVWLIISLSRLFHGEAPAWFVLGASFTLVLGIKLMAGKMLEFTKNKAPHELRKARVETARWLTKITVILALVNLVIRLVFK